MGDTVAHTHTHECMYDYMHKYMHTLVRAHILSYICLLNSSCTHAYIYMHTCNTYPKSVQAPPSMMNPNDIMVRHFSEGRRGRMQRRATRKQSAQCPSPRPSAELTEIKPRLVDPRVRFVVFAMCGKQSAARLRSPPLVFLPHAPNLAAKPRPRSKCTKTTLPELRPRPESAVQRPGTQRRVTAHKRANPPSKRRCEKGALAPCARTCLRVHASAFEGDAAKPRRFEGPESRWEALMCLL